LANIRGESVRILVIDIPSAVGAATASEASSRGHDVRTLMLGASVEGITPEAVTGCDVVVCAAPPWPRRPTSPGPLAMAKALIPAALGAGLRRIVICGGAGTLELDGAASDGHPRAFPAAMAEEAEALALYRAQADRLDWSRVDAVGVIQPGARRGTFRVGRETVLRDFRSHASISFLDYAVALVTEAERGEFVHRAVSVAY
jgi:putative NADH-flavin reductase